MCDGGEQAWELQWNNNATHQLLRDVDKLHARLADERCEERGRAGHVRGEERGAEEIVLAKDAMEKKGVIRQWPIKRQNNMKERPKLRRREENSSDMVVHLQPPCLSCFTASFQLLSCFTASFQFRSKNGFPENRGLTLRGVADGGALLEGVLGALKLGGRHHLHRAGDLLDVRHRLEAHLNCRKSVRVEKE